MAICLEISPGHDHHRRRSFPYSPLSAPVSPVGSGYHTPREGTSPRLFGLSGPSSPRASITLASSTSSLPALGHRAGLASPPGQQSSPLPHSPVTPKATRQPDPDTPRRAEEALTSSTTPTQEPREPSPSPSKDRKRSLSLPSVADPETLSPHYPSPSGGFSPPPDDEASIISELLAKDRARRQSEAASRPEAVTEARAGGKKRSSSVGSSDAGAAPAAERASQRSAAAASAGDEKDDHIASPITPSTTPSGAMSRVMSTSTGSKSSQPSRPASDYMSRLDSSVGTVPATPGLARRLSISTSRRGSEQVVPQLPSAKLPAVIVRDFAYPEADPRFIGEGQLPPQPPPPARNSSGFWGPSTSRTSSTGLTSWDELGGPDSGLLSSASSSAFSWGFITSHAEAETVDEISESMDEDDDEDETHDLGPIPEGGALYVATYDFEPEASQEMGLAAGEIVRVFERICEGWVVAGRLRPKDAEGEEETGLVPETYLTHHKGDAEDL